MYLIFQAVDSVLNRMKEANFDFSNVVAISGTAQVVAETCVISYKTSFAVIFATGIMNNIPWIYYTGPIILSQVIYSLTSKVCILITTVVCWLGFL
jgi:hypothetical protein